MHTQHSQNPVLIMKSSMAAPTAKDMGTSRSTTLWNGSPYIISARFLACNRQIARVDLFGRRGLLLSDAVHTRTKEAKEGGDRRQ